MTAKEFRGIYTQKDLHEIADEISGTIMIRDGNGDHRRETTKEEAAIIKNIAYSALLAYSYRQRDIDGILDMAEYTLMQFLPSANTYDTIYIPIRKITRTGSWA